MDIRKFQAIPIIEDMSQVKLEIGDRFLMGIRLAAQRENKVEGDMVTYYEVVDINPRSGNVSFTPRYEKLTQ